MSSIVIQGDTSGSITVEAPSVAGTHTLTLPKATGNIATDATVGLGMKNLIINGDMRIAQRGTSFSSLTSSQYCLDRFSNDIGGGGAITVAQSSTAPSNFINSMSCTVATADSSLAAGDAYRFTQVIEGLNITHLNWGTANAKTVTLSFWVRSSVTGTYGFGIQNSAETENYVSEYTISSANTWEQKTITIAGPTSGTWLTTNGKGLAIRWDLGSGTNYNGTANTWQTTGGKVYRTSSCVNWISTSGATFYVTGVQLEVGENATPFENRSYGTELALCQRYYWKMSAVEAYGPYGMGHGINTGSFRVIIHTPQTMRAYPSLGFSAASTFIWSFGNVLSSIVAAEYSSNAFSVTCQTTGISANGGYLLTAGNNTTSYIEAIAEL